MEAAGRRRLVEPCDPQEIRLARLNKTGEWRIFAAGSLADDPKDATGNAEYE
jgi:hypothetical protein